jgi:hypothetical protein
LPDNDGYFGRQQPEDASSEYNALAFVVRSIIGQHNFVALVKVINVTAPGGLALAGTVDVQPLVNQLDGRGNAIAHGVVNDLPYVRAQGGLNAIIMDPKSGTSALLCSATATARRHKLRAMWPIPAAPAARIWQTAFTSAACSTLYRTST